MLQGTLRLLCDGGAKDALQPLVHLAHPIGGGGGKHVPNHGCACSIALAQVGQPSPFIGELASSLGGFSFDVILRAASSFLQVRPRW
jgi:hypothetical protein